MAISSLRPVEKIPADIKAAELLRNSILSGEITPGTRITEQSLSHQMQLSRATVRLALHQLSSEGLVVLTPYTGWSVARLTPKDAWELSTLRAALERMACILVAESLTEQTISTLRAAYDHLVAVCKKESASEAAEADFALHAAIINLSNNSRLVTHYTQVERQARMFIFSSNALLEKPSTILDQHKPIITALLAGEAEKSGSLMEAHNIQEGKRLTAYLYSIEGDASMNASHL